MIPKYWTSSMWLIKCRKDRCLKYESMSVDELLKETLSLSKFEKYVISVIRNQLHK